MLWMDSFRPKCSLVKRPLANIGNLSFWAGHSIRRIAAEDFKIDEGCSDHDEQYIS